jgi:anaerobic selenocysteine-containing dehydrogenase
MNAPFARPSVCPHDCTSTCALEVEIQDARTIGRVRGSKRNTYTNGVICEKVARYAERVHHPDRLMHPLLRTGPKGSKQFKQISWEEALDRVADNFIEKAQRSRARVGLAVLLRRHDGARAARRHPAAAPCDEVLALVLRPSASRFPTAAGSPASAASAASICARPPSMPS